MKLKVTYKELSIILGILVAILAIFSYWLTLHPGSSLDSSLQIHTQLNFEIGKISKFIHTTLQAGFHIY